MRIRLLNGAKASEDEILLLESGIGCPLSPSFRRFVLEYDGAQPESNAFPLPSGGSSTVRWFIPVKEILTERTHLNDLPPTAYPVCPDENGNYVFIDEEQDGLVLFWDHEVEHGWEKLAANFDAFLDLLEPFDSSMVTVDPGDIIRVWIKPGFLDKLKKEGKL